MLTDIVILTIQKVNQKDLIRFKDKNKEEQKYRFKKYVKEFKIKYIKDLLMINNLMMMHYYCHKSNVVIPEVVEFEMMEDSNKAINNNKMTIKTINNQENNFKMIKMMMTVISDSFQFNSF